MIHRETEREGEGQRETHTFRNRVIHRETERERGEGQRETHTFRNRVIHRETEREREKDRERHTHIQKQSDT